MTGDWDRALTCKGIPLWQVGVMRCTGWGPQTKESSMGKIVSGCVGIALGAAIIGCLIAFPVMWLWNWLCPPLFGLPSITVWQTLGLYVLSHCLLPTSTK